MADRTIKPDSGNDLVLQNNGGGTKIEIPNSGNIAITGTIESGTLDSGVVFPAGHIVSSDFGVRANTSDLSTTSNSFNEVHSDLRVTITPTSPNKVLLIVNGGNPRIPYTYAMFSSWGIVNSSGSLTTANLAGSDGLEQIRLASDVGDDSHSGGHSYSFLHTPSSYGSPIIYTPVFRTSSNGSLVFFTEGNSNEQYVMSMAFEIKQ